jgi:hypothetical protein
MPTAYHIGDVKYLLSLWFGINVFGEATAFHQKKSDMKISEKPKDLGFAPSSQKELLSPK